MIYLILDTNNWIYLANGLDPTNNKHHHSLHFELLASLKTLHNEGRISVLINDIIFAEWERNKERCYDNIKKLQTKLIDKNNAFAEISKYANGSTESLKKEYEFGLQSMIAENEKHVNDVKEFIQNHCTHIPISQDVKLKVYELSINNLPPFHNKKNNVADAAILLSEVEYLRSKVMDFDSTAFFISNNLEEYTDGKNTHEFHPELIELIKPVDLHYQRVLPAALNISKKIISQLQEFLSELAKHAVDVFTWDIQHRENGVLMFLDVGYQSKSKGKVDYLTICVGKDNLKERPRVISFILPKELDTKEGLFLFFSNKPPEGNSAIPEFRFKDTKSIRVFFEDSNHETVTARIKNGYAENPESGITVDVFQSLLEFDYLFFMYFNADLTPQTILLPLFSFRQQYTLLPV